MDKTCPLCPKNGLLKEEIIAQTKGAYLIPAHSSPGDYLIIPLEHAESLTSLPATWWNDVKTLLTKIPRLADQYNLSVNIGHLAGQTVKHVHFWVIPRLGGYPSSGKGLAKLIGEANGQAAAPGVKDSYLEAMKGEDFVFRCKD